MPRKTSGPSAATPRAGPGSALVPVTGPARGDLARTGGADRGTVFREKDVTLVVGQPYAMGDRSIVADAVYYVGGGKVDGRGGRLGDADKVAWWDADTGYECIMLRERPGGYLRGFVGVEPGHPLYGFRHDAVPAELEIEVHGGLTYSAICQDGPSPQRCLIYEVRRICHVPVGYVPLKSATDHRPAHDAAWWFGFDCNHVYDIVPNERLDRGRFLAHETGAALRDEAYVHDQIVCLASQLRAIADGAPRPPRTGAPPPPLGLDPRRAK